MALVGYARISTAEQNLALQHDALAAVGATRVFEARGVSGAKTERPGLTEALRYLREGDTLVVWTLDHVGRSMTHLLQTVSGLQARGVGFRSLTEAIDATTPTGRPVFRIFGALGQFERDLMRERSGAGLAAAAARGRKVGRPVAATPEKVARARALMANGLTVREAAARVKVGKSRPLRRAQERHRCEPRRGGQTAPTEPSQIAERSTSRPKPRRLLFGPARRGAPARDRRAAPSGALVLGRAHHDVGGDRGHPRQRAQHLGVEVLVGSQVGGLDP
jgi:DNA invertase Pin-like site-specific DNA recombinase